MLLHRSGSRSKAAGCRIKKQETDPAMSRTELVIQLIKVALGFAIGTYFVWWSLEVLQRLPPH